MNQDHLRNSIRLAGAADDRGAARVLRLRVVRANPIVESIDMTGDIIEPHGKTVDACIGANWRALQGACTIRVGARSPDSLIGSGDYVRCIIIRSHAPQTPFDFR